MYPADSAAQRQRWPGGDGGGRQQQGGDGERQRDNGGGGARQRDGGGAGGGARQRDGGGGGGGARQRDGGGSRQRDDGGARPQGGGGQAQARAAQPRDNNGGDRGRRETPSEIRETPPQQRPIAPPPEARAEAGTQSGERQARRRVPTAAERAAEGNRGGTVIENRSGDRDRAGVVRGVDRTPNGARVAVPRPVGRPPRWDDRNDRNIYGSYYRGRNVYGRYAYHGGRNIYIVPRGRTFYYYPRYYYNPYTFGYGPAGRGHFYFDLYYNSYIWHPYSAYRYGTYGTYGYPVGELRLKVHPRDAQVFIDGSYAGRVDDFDGVFQSLRLEEGEYQVEIVLPGYEPLAFDVRIFPGEKTTYEGDLIPEP
jgi:hypothetical protein